MLASRAWSRREDSGSKVLRVLPAPGESSGDGGGRGGGAVVMKGVSAPGASWPGGLGTDVAVAIGLGGSLSLGGSRALPVLSCRRMTSPPCSLGLRQLVCGRGAQISGVQLSAVLAICVLGGGGRKAGGWGSVQLRFQKSFNPGSRCREDVL